MGENSNIEWTDHTFNGWIGCTKVSPGCDHCYAETLMDKRWHKVKWGHGEPRVLTSESNWNLPIHWNHRAQLNGARERVFCASLGDVFDTEVPDEWRQRLFRIIVETPSLVWLLLTKRPIMAIRHSPFLIEHDNVWLGVSVENQEMAELRIPIALMASPRVFLSMEPLLSRVHLGTLLQRVGWAIVGGESGSSFRPMPLEWARDIRDECAAAGVPFFMKQTAGKGFIPPDLLIRETPF